MSDDHCLVFLHIPRTAGTTLESAIHKNYPKESIYALSDKDLYTDVGRLRKMPVEKRRRFRYFFGHCPYGLHRLMPERRVTYLTLLREPVDRIVSTYFHIAEHPEHLLHGHIARDGMTLEEFALSDQWPRIRNTMTRILGAELEDFTLEPYRRFNNHLADEEDYWRARARAADGMLFGIQEHFHASVVMFARSLKWKVYGYADQRISATRPRLRDLPGALIERIQRHHAHDVMLYDFAYRLFMQRCLDLGINIIEHQHRRRGDRAVAIAEKGAAAAKSEISATK